MKNVNNYWNWKLEPLRYDPSRDYLLCEMCWNYRHTTKNYTSEGNRAGLVNLCLGGGCRCGCTDKGPKKVKFTGEGQTEISMESPLEITGNS